MLKIKLFPMGKKHQRTFRLVVSESRSKFDGNYVEDLGFYTPQTKTLEYDKEKFAKWVKNGAQVTLGVDKLINPDKHIRVKKAKPLVEKSPEAKATPVPETPAVETPSAEVKTEQVKE